MPYIPHDRRNELTRTKGNPKTPGELNYFLTQEVLGYIYRAQNQNHFFRSYSLYNEVIGVLECMKQEIYRRLIVPFEDDKCEDNGDVFQ